MNYILKRSKRKTIALYIRDGQLEVRAPLRLPKAVIDEFVSSKKSWITEHLARHAAIEAKRSAFSLNYGSTILYRGHDYTISAHTSHKVFLDEKTEKLNLPPALSENEIKSEVIKLYKTLAKDYLTKRVDYYCIKMGVNIKGLKINSAKKRWGSMSSLGCVNFSWRIIIASDDIIDFVVIHELAHIYEMNHSKRFWAIVDSFVPDRREREKVLKEFTDRINSENWDL